MKKNYITWTDTGIDLKGRISGNVKTQCPECSENRRNKKDPCLSVDISNQVWNCHNCQWKGGLSTKPTEPRKEYKKPDFEPQEPTEKMQKWFLDKRGITADTLAKFLISPKKTFIHKAGAVVDCIAFPYVRGTEIVNIKSRYDYSDNGEHKKTFAMEAQAELIFYNLNAIDGKFDHCVIVEGEIDCMAVWQATKQPCISVPNGASQGDQKMEYLDNCFDHLKKLKTIVLATDSDEVGLKLREDLARRLGKDRCYYVVYPEGCKDMNEVLLMYGPDKIEEMFSELHPFPIDGVITFESVEAEFDYYYENGYPKGATIGLKELDNLITWRGGEVTTLTGIPGHGKSEILDEILVRLSTQHDWRHGLFAAENGSAALHYGRIAHRFIGKPFWRWDWKMSKEELDLSKAFMSDKFFFINRKEVQTNIDSLLEKAREMVMRKGINSFVIDPYNCMESNRPANVNETEYVSQIYDKMVNFAELYNVHVILVAHPTKMKRNEKTNKFEVPTMYSISGSANFYNKTYNGLSVYRDFQAGLTTVYVQKVKFDFIGKTGFANFTFNKDQRRYEPAVVIEPDEDNTL